MTSGAKTTLFLTRGLIVSGALNICLLAFLFIFLVQERPLISWSRMKPLVFSTVTQDIEETTTNVVVSLLDLPFDILVEKLEETQIVEDGYSLRDLSLGVMVSKHMFDLERALQGLPRPYEDRLLRVSVGEDTSLEILVYPGLNDVQFRAIQEFAQNEKWPFIAEGLFFLLQKWGLEESLMASFSLTHEFVTLDKLFYDLEDPVKPYTLIKILLESDWATFTHSIKKPSLTRQSFLMDYTALHSKAAASLLIETDPIYATKKLDDQSVMLILGLIDTEKSDYTKQILLSPRSQATVFMAAEKLYAQAKEPFPDPFDYKQTLAKFCPTEEIIETPHIKAHTVSAGDSLWKISRQYQVSVQAIKEHNKLTSDTLRLGMVLLLP